VQAYGDLAQISQKAALTYGFEFFVYARYIM